MQPVHFRIRTKLFLSYSSVFLILLIVVSLGIYFFVKITIEENIEGELEQSTDTLLNMVQTAAEVSLKNYLRATAEKNLEITRYYYNRTLTGELTEKDAKQQVAQIFLHQHIGKSGYIYSINSKGILLVHPEASLLGVDISSYDFVDEQKRKKNGYLVYDWQNPGEKNKRGKALYMAYFKPWDWIISVSTYRSEFRQLVKLDDFRARILALSFGKTGYSFVMDLKGNLIIHPQLEGHNIYGEQDAKGRFFIKEICEKKKGKIIYPWQNPGDPGPRKKLVIFNYIPQFQWIVASSSYLDEFFAPLTTIRSFMIGAMIVALLILLPLTLVISHTITTPLHELMSHFSKPSGSKFTHRITEKYSGEIGNLAHYFNQFMEKLERDENKLKKEIQVRAQAQRALRQSEEMFSKAFSLSPIGIIILSYPKGRIISANDSFVKMTGFSRETLYKRSLLRLRLFPSMNDVLTLQKELADKKQLRERAMVFLTSDQEKKQALISSDLIDLWGDTYILTIVEDITKRQQLQERILDIGETERQKIGQDIHDDLCPHLIGTEVMVKILQKKLENELPEVAVTAEKIRRLIKEAIKKSRGMARGLSPVFLVSRGLETAIEELAITTSELYNLTCIFKRPGHLVFPDRGDIIHIFLIIQEAVTNSIRHAEADTISIEIKDCKSVVQISIEDNGIGISHENEPSGMGLKIMRYRAERIRSEITMVPSQNGGTRIVVSLHKSITLEGSPRLLINEEVT